MQVLASEQRIMREAGVLLIQNCLLSECLLRNLGVSESDMHGLKQMTDAHEHKLQAVLELTSSSTGCFVFDLGQSHQRLMETSHIEGVCPCVTRTNSHHRLWCTAVNRYLTPYECMLMLGFEWEVILSMATSMQCIPGGGMQLMGVMVGQCVSPWAWKVLMRTCYRMYGEDLSVPISMPIEHCVQECVQECVPDLSMHMPIEQDMHVAMDHEEEEEPLPDTQEEDDGNEAKVSKDQELQDAGNEAKVSADGSHRGALPTWEATVPADMARQHGTMWHNMG